MKFTVASINLAWIKPLSHKVVTLTLKKSFGVVHILKVPIFKYVECVLRVKVSLLSCVSTLVTCAQKHSTAQTLSIFHNK